LGFCYFRSRLFAFLGGGTYAYGGAGSPGQFAEYDGNFSNPTYTVFDGAVGTETYNVPFNINRSGIDVLAASLAHESTHQVVDQNQISGIWPIQGSPGDMDGDELPNFFEINRSSTGYNETMRFSTAFIGFLMEMMKKFIAKKWLNLLQEIVV